jgi:hypothetical protein
MVVGTEACFLQSISCGVCTGEPKTPCGVKVESHHQSSKGLLRKREGSMERTGKSLLSEGSV